MTSPAPASTETPTATTTPAPTTTQTTTPAPVPFTPEQQAEIDRRAAAARKEGETAGKKAADDAIAAAKAKADEDAERTRQIAAGEFDKVRGDLESKVATLTTERDGFKKRYEDALAQIEPGVAAKWKDVPAEVVALYTGADDDPIAKAAFLAKSEPLIQLATGKGGGGTAKPAWPSTPRPNGSTPEAVAESEKQRLRQSGKYAV